MLLRLKDKNNAMLQARLESARAVIDDMARVVGINPDDTSYYLYSPDPDGGSAIAEKMKEYISRAGNKAELKKRIDELEAENAVLRSLITK